jgi:hypothetical protein
MGTFDEEITTEMEMITQTDRDESNFPAFLDLPFGAGHNGTLPPSLLVVKSLMFLL